MPERLTRFRAWQLRRRLRAAYRKPQSDWHIHVHVPEHRLVADSREFEQAVIRALTRANRRGTGGIA